MEGVDTFEDLIALARPEFFGLSVRFDFEDVGFLRITGENPASLNADDFLFL